MHTMQVCHSPPLDVDVVVALRGEWPDRTVRSPGYEQLRSCEIGCMCGRKGVVWMVQTSGRE